MGVLEAGSFRVNLLPDLESLQKKMHEISVILNLLKVCLLLLESHSQVRPKKVKVA